MVDAVAAAAVVVKRAEKQVKAELVAAAAAVVAAEAEAEPEVEAEVEAMADTGSTPAMLITLPTRAKSAPPVSEIIAIKRPSS